MTAQPILWGMCPECRGQGYFVTSGNHPGWDDPYAVDEIACEWCLGLGSIEDGEPMDDEDWDNFLEVA